jgi:ADP-ribose pyrophosphatase
MPRITDRQVAFSTPWFDVVAKDVEGGPSPHYTVRPPDYATVLATDTDGRVLLVRQYRPVVEGYTIELPSGLVDPGETPEQSIRRELLEETGHQVAEIECLGSLVPDTGRLGNRMWCFAASGARRVSDVLDTEEGIELLIYSCEEFVDAMRSQRCDHALNLAAVMLAVMKGRFGTFTL